MVQNTNCVVRGQQHIVVVVVDLAVGEVVFCGILVVLRDLGLYFG